MSVPWRVCPRCLRPVMALLNERNLRIGVDPTPTPDGPLLVNGLAGRVIGQTPGSGPGHHEVGWWPHTMVCSRWLPPRRPDPPLHLPPRRALRAPERSYEAVTRIGEPPNTRRRAPR